MEKLLFECLEFKKIKKMVFEKEFGEKATFNFLNSHDLYQYKKNRIFQNSLNEKNINNFNFIDGFVVSLILSLKNFKKVSRMRGPGFVKLFLKDKKLNLNKKHFFIGLDKKNKKKLFKKIKTTNEKNVNCYNPPYIKGQKFQEEEIKKIVNKINKFEPQFIWICVGSPKQNILSKEIYNQLKIKSFLIFNVGAALDFLIKKKKEAPRIFQKIGIEWLYRFITDFKNSKKKIWRSFLGSFWAINIIKLKNEK